MARGKKGRKTANNVSTETRSAETAQGDDITQVKHRFSIFDYLLICLCFIAFCYLQKGVTLWYMGVPSGKDGLLESQALDFFFNTLWKGFVVVTVLVWLHDFFYQESEDESG